MELIFFVHVRLTMCLCIVMRLCSASNRLALRAMASVHSKV